MIKKCVACDKQFDAATNRKRFCSYYCATGHVHELSWLLPKKVRVRKRKKTGKRGRLERTINPSELFEKLKPVNPRNVKLMKEYRSGKSCEKCKSDKQLAVHHIDHNKHNNCFENYMVLCVKCHRLEHPDLPGVLFRCLEE